MTAHRRHLILPLAAAVLALLYFDAPPLEAGSGSGTAFIVNKSDIGSVALSAEEEALIRSYFKINADGLNDLRPLSQGVQKTLTPGAPLPLINTRRSLPAALDSRLTSRRDLDYLVLGEDVVLFNTATQRIISILKDVRRGG